MLEAKIGQGVEGPPLPGLPAPDGKWRTTLRRIKARFPYYVEYIRDDPKWLFMFVSGRFVLVRRVLWKLASGPVAAQANGPTLLGDIDVEAIVTTIREQGTYPGLQLPETIISGIRAFADRTVCYGNIEKNLPFLPANHREAEQAFGKPILVGHFHDAIEKCPEVVAVRDDPVLQAIARTYLNADVHLINSRLWWSFPTTSYDEAALSRASQERYHFDMNDWRSLKFFFYLTDVDEENGPHVYVAQSHRLRPLRHQFTLVVGKSEADIRSAYGDARIMRICGPAGYGFAEDPFCFHMGTAPRSRRRLILEVEYGVSRRSAARGGRLF